MPLVFLESTILLGLKEHHIGRFIERVLLDIHPRSVNVGADHFCSFFTRFLAYNSQHDQLLFYNAIDLIAGV